MTEMTINWSLTRSFKKIQMRTRCSTVIVDTSTPAEPFTKKLLDASMAQRISRVRHCISQFLFYHIMQERQRERVMVFDLGCLFKTKTQSSR